MTRKQKHREYVGPLLNSLQMTLNWVGKASMSEGKAILQRHLDRLARTVLLTDKCKDDITKEPITG